MILEKTHLRAISVRTFSGFLEFFIESPNNRILLIGTFMFKAYKSLKPKCAKTIYDLTFKTVQE